MPIATKTLCFWFFYLLAFCVKFGLEKGLCHCNRASKPSFHTLLTLVASAFGLGRIYLFQNTEWMLYVPLEYSFLPSQEVGKCPSPWNHIICVQAWVFFVCLFLPERWQVTLCLLGNWDWKLGFCCCIKLTLVSYLTEIWRSKGFWIASVIFPKMWVWQEIFILKQHRDPCTYWQKMLA